MEIYINCKDCGTNLKKESKVTEDANHEQIEIDVSVCPECEKNIHDNTKNEIESDYDKQISDLEETIEELENKVADLEEVVESGIHVAKDDIETAIRATRI